MCCFFAILATIVPRLALLLLWVATPLVIRAFDSFLVPLIGLIFLPFTTIAYVLVYSPVYGVSVFGWFLIPNGMPDAPSTTKVAKSSQGGAPLSVPRGCEDAVL
ncbi:MAG TPA: hypothetical protein VHS06_11575 [Chloroflexota bacterium]|nr:hypothetical protein [Chloroflexota bacterium]